MRYTNVDRVENICQNVSFAASGDFSDYQKISELLKQESHRLKTYANITKADPKQFGKYLAALCYAKRNTVDPFMVESILCGVKNGE